MTQTMVLDVHFTPRYSHKSDSHFIDGGLNSSCKNSANTLDRTLIYGLTKDEYAGIYCHDGEFDIFYFHLEHRVTAALVCRDLSLHMYCQFVTYSEYVSSLYICFGVTY